MCHHQARMFTFTTHSLFPTLMLYAWFCDCIVLRQSLSLWFTARRFGFWSHCLLLLSLFDDLVSYAHCQVSGLGGQDGGHRVHELLSENGRGNFRNTEVSWLSLTTAVRANVNPKKIDDLRVCIAIDVHGVAMMICFAPGLFS